MAKWLIVFFIVCFFSSLNAQKSVVVGTVKDSITDNPVDFVSVYVSSKKGDIISFGYTNKKGKYSIECDVLDMDSIVITANYLGYAKKSHFLSRAENSNTLEQDFLLKPINFELKEIVVKERNLPIIQRRDTTTYDVKQFIDSTEYTIEDVLKKLPGVHVNEKGGISINGQPIHKVLVEGDDMFGANYTIGTKNVRGSIIDKVQVIDGYNDNPVLDNVVTSEKIVLNITIKDEKKNILSGNYTIGLGYGKDVKRHLNANLISISKKSKTLLFGNHNNDGFNAKGEVSVINSGISQITENEIPSYLSVIGLPSIEHDFLPERLMSNRRINLANFSQIFNLTPHFKLKIIGTHYQRRNSQNYSDLNIFYAPEDTLVFAEQSNFQKKEIDTNITLQTDFLSKKLDKSLRSTSSLAAYNRKVEVVLNRRENNTFSDIPQEIEETPLAFYNALDYTQKVGKNAIYQLGVNHFFSKNPQTLNARYEEYASLTGNANLDSLGQSSDVVQNISNAYVRYLYNKYFLLDVKIGIHYNHTSIKTRSDIQGLENSFLLYSNDISISQLAPILKVLVKKRLSLFDVSIGVQNSYDKIQNLGFERKEYFRSMPFLQISFPISSKMSLKTFYQYRKDLPAFNTLARQFIFTNYQTVSKGNTAVELIDEQRVSLNLKYNNPVDVMYFNLNGFYSLSRNATGTSFSFTNDIFEQFLYNPAPIRGGGASLNIEKLFWKINSRFKLQYSFSTYSTETRLNQLSEDIELFNHEFLFDYGSSFSLPINFYLTSRLILGKSKLLISNAESKATIINTKFKVVYRASKNTFFDVKWYANTNNGNTGSTIFFNTLDATITHQIKTKNKKKGRLSLTLSNVFNKKSFVTQDVGNFYFRENSIEITERFFLIKWEPFF